MNLSVENVLMIVLVAFALHYLMRNCGCRVEGYEIVDLPEGSCCDPGAGNCAQGLECNLVNPLKSDCNNHSWSEGPYYLGKCAKKSH